MPKIKETIKIYGKNRGEVYELIKKIDEYPSFVNNIKKSQILETHGNRAVTSWEIGIDSISICWKEEDILDDQNMILRFNMIEGDYGRYEGEWLLEDIPGGTKITLTANFDWGIPILEKFVGDTLFKKAKIYIKGFLMAIKKKLEARK